VDSPPAPSAPGSGVLIRLDSGETRPLRDLSPLVAGLTEAQRSHWRLRVMAPPEAKEAAERAARAVLGA